GGTRRALFPPTSSPFGSSRSTFPCAARRREAAFSTSVEPLHDLFEYVTAMFKIIEHAEGGAGGREQHDAARRRHGARPIDRFLERTGIGHRHTSVSERGADLRGVLADQHRMGDPATGRGGERFEV